MNLAHKTLECRNMLRIVCYSTKKAQMLSKKDKLNRLFNNYMKTICTMNPIEDKTASSRNHYISNAKYDFEQLLHLPKDHHRFREIITKYEKYIVANVDVNSIGLNNKQALHYNQLEAMYANNKKTAQKMAQTNSNEQSGEQKNYAININNKSKKEEGNINEDGEKNTKDNQNDTSKNKMQSTDQSNISTQQADFTQSRDKQNEFKVHTQNQSNPNSDNEFAQKDKNIKDQTIKEVIGQKSPGKVKENLRNEAQDLLRHQKHKSKKNPQSFIQDGSSDNINKNFDQNTSPTSGTNHKKSQKNKNINVIQEQSFQPANPNVDQNLNEQRSPSDFKEQKLTKHKKPSLEEQEYYQPEFTETENLNKRKDYLDIDQNEPRISVSKDLQQEQLDQSSVTGFGPNQSNSNKFKGFKKIYNTSNIKDSASLNKNQKIAKAFGEYKNSQNINEQRQDINQGYQSSNRDQDGYDKNVDRNKADQSTFDKIKDKAEEVIDKAPKLGHKAKKALSKDKDKKQNKSDNQNADKDKESLGEKIKDVHEDTKETIKDKLDTSKASKEQDKSKGNTMTNNVGHMYEKGKEKLKENVNKNMETMKDKIINNAESYKPTSNPKNQRNDHTTQNATTDKNVDKNLSKSGKVIRR